MQERLERLPLIPRTFEGGTSVGSVRFLDGTAIGTNGRLSASVCARPCEIRSRRDATRRTEKIDGDKGEEEDGATTRRSSFSRRGGCSNQPLLAALVAAPLAVSRTHIARRGRSPFAKGEAPPGGHNASSAPQRRKLSHRSALVRFRSFGIDRQYPSRTYIVRRDARLPLYIKKMYQGVGLEAADGGVAQRQ